ncbi:MAG TPA: hypothetical protein VN914_04865 [Polyangia bacterium]|nr:hypothetical protein [Polyangia bacterium]
MMVLARVLAALPLIVQAGGGSSAPPDSIADRVRAVVRTLQPDLDRCSKLASDRGQMGDVIVSLDKVKSRHVRRAYRAIGVDGDVLACVRKAFDEHAGFLTNAGLDISVDRYSYHEDIPLGVKRLLFPVTEDFFREWDRRRRIASEWTRWAGVPAGVEMTPDGCLVLPETKQLGNAHMDWRVEVGKRWPMVDPAQWKPLRERPDGMVRYAHRVAPGLALLIIGPKLQPVYRRPQWGDPLGTKICLQELATKDTAPIR